MKATYVETLEVCEEADDCIMYPDPCNPCMNKRPVGQEIFKDPITDDGIKKSARGLLMVGELGDGSYELHDQVGWYEEERGALITIFEDGVLNNEVSLSQIRERLNNN